MLTGRIQWPIRRGIDACRAGQDDDTAAGHGVLPKKMQAQIDGHQRAVEHHAAGEQVRWWWEAVSVRRMFCIEGAPLDNASVREDWGL